MNLKVIVTGVGRSGTTYMARLLTSMNIKCGHESIFDYSDDQIIRERILDPRKRVISRVSTQNKQKWINPIETIAESSYLSVPYLDWPELNDVKIIHIYRNPIKVARSFILDFGYFSENKPNKQNPFNELGFEEKIWSFLPELSYIRTQEERFCYFYFKWNQLAVEKSKNKEVLSIKVEEDNIYKITNFLNIEKTNNLFNNKKENTYDSNRKFGLSDIPKGEIKNDFIKFMHKIGYYGCL